MSASKLEILAYEDTALGPLCLRRRELLASPGTVVTEVTLNHEFLMSSLYTASETALATFALEMHGGSGLRVLLGGLGLGYTAHAALTSGRVEDLLVLELFPEVVEWLDEGLLPLSRELTADRRLSTKVNDFFRVMNAAAAARFDLVLVDIDHAPDQLLDDASAAFYRNEGLRAVREHLASEGVLAVWSSADSPAFLDELQTVFDEVRAEPVSFFNHLVDEETTDWIFLAR